MGQFSPRHRSTVQSRVRGAAFPQVPLESRGSGSLFISGHGQRQLFLRVDPYPGRIGEGREMLPSWGHRTRKLQSP